MPRHSLRFWAAIGVLSTLLLATAVVVVWCVLFPEAYVTRDTAEATALRPTLVSLGILLALGTLLLAALAYRASERDAAVLYRRLLELNAGLDETVAQRSAELHASEERFRLAVRGSNDGLWDWHVTTGEVFYSARFKDLLGYEGDEFPNQFSSFQSHLHPDDVAPVLSAIKAHLERREPYDVEYRLRNKAGEYRWIRARGQALWDEQGRASRMAGSITDVTDRKEVELALRHERFLLETLLSHLPDAIYFKDLEGRFMRVSSFLARHLGNYSPEEVLGKSDRDFFPAEYAAQARADEEVLIQSGLPLTSKVEHPLWANGTDTFVLTTKIPLRDEQGEIIGTFGISRDITTVKQAQATLLRAKEAAESANRAKSDFLANMSHEIRTPMNAVIGMTELVLDTPLTPAQQDYLTIVLESAESLLSIINQILDFSKIEAGKLELEELDFALREEVGDTLKSLALRAHTKGIELAWHVNKNVPDLLRGDPVRLRQILVNLVGNAIKFTQQGEVLVDVQAESVGESAANLHFLVRDTGVGIPADKLDMIFGAFQQADTSTTRQYGGTGLGLTISSRIIETMGGRIWAESEPDVGSQFHFTAEFRLGRAEDRLRDLILPDLTQLPVVVVDDNATNRRILKEMVEGWGMSVTTVAGGSEALALLRELRQRQGTPPPLLLSDVNMPEMDGFSLAEQIRATAAIHDTLIIMLTSGGRPGDIVRCEQLGVLAHLMKPVKQSELLDAIMLCLGRPHKSFPEQPGVSTADLPKLPRLRILLAEDGKANQKLATAMLEKWGHSVTVAENGRAAIDGWAAGSFDLILMDVQMPVMDGLQATRRIREREVETGAHIPIIALTARAMKGDRERCLEAGMDGYISKPVRKQEMVEAIAPLFASAQPSDPVERDARAEGNGESGRGAFLLDADGVDQSSGLSSSSAPSETTARVIDWQAALESADNDSEILATILKAGLDELPRLRRDLRRALDDGDGSLVRRCAHTIKSNARTFGAERVASLAAQVEQLASANDLESLREPSDRLDAGIETMVREMEARAGSP